MHQNLDCFQYDTASKLYQPVWKTPFNYDLNQTQNKLANIFSRYIIPYRPIPKLMQLNKPGWLTINDHWHQKV